MSLQYIQRTGELLVNGSFFALCYAGHGVGVNNPDMQKVHSIGPLPVGKYFIGAPQDGGHLGPCHMALEPHMDNVMFDRSDFFIHADKMDAFTNPRQASEGCIVPMFTQTRTARAVREYIAEMVHAGDNVLTVVAERNVVTLAVTVSGFVPAKYAVPATTVGNVILRLMTSQACTIFPKE